MKIITRTLAIAALAATIGGGAGTVSAEAKGFKGGGHGGHHSGRHFGGHRFVKFGFGHNNCWRFGKWICGPGGY